MSRAKRKYKLSEALKDFMPGLSKRPRVEPKVSKMRLLLKDLKVHRVLRARKQKALLAGPKRRRVGSAGSGGNSSATIEAISEEVEDVETPPPPETDILP